MRELAETLKRRAGLRMRQGVVVAVDGSTCSVLIGGSTVPVEGVQHLNSCSPKVDDVVWITSDGADLWIMGTHGAPPPIDPELLPAFSTYFTDADSAGNPDPVTGAAGAAVFGVVVLAWDLPPEALWRTWRVYEGTEDGFSPGEPILETPNNVVRVQRAAGSGPWYYKIRAVNSRGEVSTDVQVGPFTVPEVGTADIAADAVTAAKIKAGEITAAKLNVADVQAAVVTAAAINALTIDAVEITGGSISGTTINGGTITGAQVKVTGKLVMGSGGILQSGADSVRRIVLTNSPANRILFYSNLAAEKEPGHVGVATWDTRGMVHIRSPRLHDTSAAPEIMIGQGAADNGEIAMVAGDGVTINGYSVIKPPVCTVIRPSNQSIPDATNTVINFTASATKEADTDGMFSTSETDRLTVKTAGFYLITACVEWAPGSTGYRHLHVNAGGAVRAQSRQPAPSASVVSDQTVSCVVQLALEDTIQMVVRHTQGASLNAAYVSAYSPRLSAMWLRAPV